ncbi:MAG: hypothetical protein Q4P29_08075 [Tissierellia bacterium]|nr:hypothetical protein [Tissierellia bacterium]
MNLLICEIKRVFKSLIFLGLAFALTISITSQVNEKFFEFKAPNPNQDSYGRNLTDDLDFIFPNLISDLYYAIDRNSFDTYPYGFYREKNLEKDELNALKDIVSDILNTPYENIDLDNIKIPENENFEEQLNKIDSIIGGGTFYAKDKYKVHFGKKNISYDEALEDYNLMKNSGYDTAFARYFSDYSGIFVLLLTWFMALYLWNKDRKEGVANTIYVKKVSSLKLVLFRILAMSIALMVVILALFSYYEIKLMNINGTSILNPLKAYLIVFLWIFPIILFVTSISSFLTIATNSILLGFLGPVFSFIYIMLSSANIFYNIGYGLLIRYNSVGNEAYFLSKFNLFLTGRILWIAISALIIVLTALIYEKRRRGYNAFKNKFATKNRTKA